MSDWKELEAREKGGGSLHIRLGAKLLSENLYLFANALDLSLKARGLQLYIIIIKSSLQTIILWNSDWVVKSAGAEGLEVESWKMHFSTLDPLLMLMGIMEMYYLISLMGRVQLCLTLQDKDKKHRKTLEDTEKCLGIVFQWKAIQVAS